MDKLENHQTLPVQLRILIPVSPSPIYQQLLKEIKDYFPDITCRFYLLNISDRANLKKQLEIRRKLSRLAAKTLNGFHYHIFFRSGNAIENILLTAIHHHCDLIIAASDDQFCLQFDEKKIRIKNLIKKSPLPVLSVPGKINVNKSMFPIRKSLVLINPTEKNRLCSAFAIRCARLVSSQIYVTTSGKSADHEQSNQNIKFLCERYWSPADESSLEIIDQNPLEFQQTVQNVNPDFVIIALNDQPIFKRFNIIDSVKLTVLKSEIPVLVVQRRDWLKEIEKKYLPIYNSISEFELAHSVKPESDNTKKSRFIKSDKQLLLGCYSSEGIKTVFEKYGFFKSLTRRGYPNACVVVTCEENAMERIRVFPDCSQNKEPLVDLVFRRETLPSFQNFPPGYPTQLGPYLYIQWLCLQDPERKYRDLEIQLPGQKHPGLGLGWRVMIIIKLLAHRIEAVGVYNKPEYYHTARFYHRYFHYLDPALEGRLLALDRDTFPSHVVDTSWALLHGVVQQNNRPCEWIGGPQILPLHPKLEAYFQSDYYQKILHEHMSDLRFALDHDRMNNMIKDRSLYREPGDIKSFNFGG